MQNLEGEEFWLCLLDSDSSQNLSEFPGAGLGLAIAS
jgi:hypothetical protein